MEKLLLRAGTEGEREREGVVYVEGLEILEDRGGEGTPLEKRYTEKQ